MCPKRQDLGRVEQGPAFVKRKPQNDFVCVLERASRKDLFAFLRKVDIKSGGCWLGLSHKRPTGYGYVCDDRTTITSRLAYILFVEDINDSVHVDHLCRNPS